MSKGYIEEIGFKTSCEKNCFGVCVNGCIVSRTEACYRIDQILSCYSGDCFR